MIKYKTIVLSGGGPKGVVHLGSLEYCNELGLLDHIQNYWGVSVGSIICIFLILNFKPQEIFELFFKYGLLKIEDILRPELLGVFPIDSLGKRVVELLNMSGYYRENTTFRNLFIQTNKKLNIVGTCMDEPHEVVFNFEKTPDMKIIDAIEISCALPFIFTDKIYNDQKYIDGGFVNELPIDLADPTMFTLAIWIKTAGTGHSMLDTVYKLLSIPMNRFQEMRNKIYGERGNMDIIKIETSGFGFLDLNPTRVRQIEMFGDGYKQTEKYFTKRFMDGWDWDYCIS